MIGGNRRHEFSAFAVPENEDVPRIYLGLRAKEIECGGDVGDQRAARTVRGASARADAALVVPQHDIARVRERVAELQKDRIGPDRLVAVLRAASVNEDDAGHARRNAVGDRERAG